MTECHNMISSNTSVKPWSVPHKGSLEKDSRTGLFIGPKDK